LGAEDVPGPGQARRGLGRRRIEMIKKETEYGLIRGIHSREMIHSKDIEKRVVAVSGREAIRVGKVIVCHVLFHKDVRHRRIWPRIMLVILEVMQIWMGPWVWLRDLLCGVKRVGPSNIRGDLKENIKGPRGTVRVNIRSNRPSIVF